MSKLILGINAFHGDASACLLVDGTLVAAAEEERFTRVKHAAGFPAQALAYCLEHAGCTLEDVDAIAVNSDPRARLSQKLKFALSHPPNLHLLWSRVRAALRKLPASGDWPTPPSGRRWPTVHRVEHHQAHLAQAFYSSPFEQAHCVSVDGFGDFASAVSAIGTPAAIKPAAAVLFPHSLGVFYQALTQYLGFPNYGDEYKLMGLAAHGDAGKAPSLDEVLKLDRDGRFRLGLKYFRHHRARVALTWIEGAPRVERLFSDHLEALAGPARQAEAVLDEQHCHLAARVQQRFEMALWHWLDTAERLPPSDALVLAGGCAMNSVAVGKILQRGKYARIHVPPAAGDAGGAVGAAAVTYQRLTGQRPTVGETPYLGSEPTDADIRTAIAGLDADRFAVSWPENDVVAAWVASALAAGQVVAWARGRMEWGARALGNRSILADPRRADMREILNRKIKLRETFRPFAPSILREHVRDWFDTDCDVPHMTHVVPVAPRRRAQIPAVVNVDGTARLQTVTASANPDYYALISEFWRLTGVPMVLNTSFNENEPIVRTAAEAVACFERTGLDLLVLGDCVISRSRGVARDNIC